VRKLRHRLRSPQPRLGHRSFLAQPGVREGPLDRGRQTRELVLHHVIARTGLQRLDSGALADRARHEDERSGGNEPAAEIERFKAAEAGDGEIRQHDVRLERRQFTLERAAVLYSPVLARDARPQQRSVQQAGIRGGILYDQDS
jgi:hypothetical protein